MLKTPGTPASISVPSGYNTSGSYTISWGVASGTVSRYEYRQQKDGSWGSWTNNSTSRSKPFSGQSEAAYAYQARACNATGCGGARTSSEFTVLKLPSQVTGLSSSVSQTTGSFTLDWNASTGTISHYKIEQKYESGNWVSCPMSAYSWDD